MKAMKIFVLTLAAAGLLVACGSGDKKDDETKGRVLAHDAHRGIFLV